MLKEQIKMLLQFIIAFYDIYSGDNRIGENSLTFFRTLSLYRELRWIQSCIEQDAYHQAIRELRFILDSIIQAYYVDKMHPDSEMSCKLEIVKEIENWRYGTRLIEETDLGHKEDLKRLYKELSEYVHSSYKEPDSSRPKTAKKIAHLKFERDSEMINLCVRASNQCIDVVFFVAISLFPQIFGLQTKREKMKRSFIDSLKKFQCEMTLDKLKAISGFLPTKK